MSAASRTRGGAALLLAALLGGCNAPSGAGAVVEDAAAGGDPLDYSLPAAAGADLAEPMRCHDDGEGDDCQDDTFCRCAGERGDGGACAEGTCLPWRGADPDHDVTCRGGPFPEAELRTPSVACRWRSPQGRSDVISTPLVF